MKKKYEKPIVLFEDFTLNTNIAGDCEKIVTEFAISDCVIQGTGGITFFASDECDITVIDIDILEVDDFCYHIPEDDRTLFNS